MPFAILAMLGIVSFAGHAVVLFGGRAALLAKAYAGYKATEVVLSRRAGYWQARAKVTLSQVNAAFIVYVHAWRRHNERYAPLPSGPFDAEVVELLKRQFPHVAGRRGSGAPLQNAEDEP